MRDKKNNSAAKTMHISNILSSSMQENETRQKAISWWCKDESETDGDKINMDEKKKNSDDDNEEGKFNEVIYNKNMRWILQF